MPIKPENLGKYPKNWKTEIRPAILARAGNRCEWPGCDVLDGSWGIRFADGTFDSPRLPDECHDYPGSRFVHIVLTVAHLDHDPNNCDPENLRAWCQYHHLNYDARHHAESARQTRERRALRLQPTLEGL
jgi:hypothetical protein